MSNRFRDLVYRFLQILLLFFTGTGIFSYFFQYDKITVILGAQLLSLLFVLSNFSVLRNIDKEPHSIFYRRFIRVFAIRFVFVIAALVIVLMLIKFHQIYFTVSFIISYILHSVIEIFSINQILQTDN